MAYGPQPPQRHDRPVVVDFLALRVRPDGGEEGVDLLLGGRAGGEGSTDAVVAEGLAVDVAGFDQPVGEPDRAVPGPESELLRAVTMADAPQGAAGEGDLVDLWSGIGALGPLRWTARDVERRMTGVGDVHLAGLQIEARKAGGDELAAPSGSLSRRLTGSLAGSGDRRAFGGAAHQGVEPTQEFLDRMRLFGEEVHARLDHRHAQAGGQAVARDVGDENRQAFAGERQDVVVVAADRGAGFEVGGDLGPRVQIQPVGQKAGLKLPRDVEFVLQRLLLNRGLHQSLQVFGHVVEGALEGADLVLAAHRNAHREVAARHRLGRPAHPVHRPRQAEDHEAGEEQGHQVDVEEERGQDGDRRPDRGAELGVAGKQHGAHRRGGGADGGYHRGVVTFAGRGVQERRRIVGPADRWIAQYAVPQGVLGAMGARPCRRPALVGFRLRVVDRHRRVGDSHRVSGVLDAVVLLGVVDRQIAIGLDVLARPAVVAAFARPFGPAAPLGSNIAQAAPAASRWKC